jgi:ATP-dependent Lon protease
MAALRAGVKTVLIPTENEPDLDDIDQTVKRSLNFVTTDNVDGILSMVLDYSVSGNEESLDRVTQIIEKEQTLPNAGPALTH